MNKEGRKMQHYAVSSSGVLTHINHAHKSNDDFFCPNCGSRMIKKCGNIRDWHFAHNWRFGDDSQRECTYETYLHGYAKLRIKQWFEESNSIILCYDVSNRCELFQTCGIENVKKWLNCVKNEKRSFDLKTRLDVCEVEKNFNIEGRTYRPDLLWRNSRNNNCFIFIDIKVTHECTDVKKDSGARIIEFEVHSEEDIDEIINHDIREDELTHFYGFNCIKQPSDDYKFKPLFNLKKFRLYTSGKVHLDSNNTTCQNYLERSKSSLLEITFANSQMDEKQLFAFGLMEATNNGFDIKNCCICKHKKYDESQNQNQCCCLGVPTTIKNNNEAVNCEQFELKYNCFKCSDMPPSIIDWWVKPTAN